MRDARTRPLPETPNRGGVLPTLDGVEQSLVSVGACRVLNRVGALPNAHEKLRTAAAFRAGVPHLPPRSRADGVVHESAPSAALGPTRPRRTTAAERVDGVGRDVAGAPAVAVR